MSGMKELKDMSYTELEQERQRVAKLIEMDKRGETAYDVDDIMQMWPPQHLLENPDPLDMKYIADAMAEAAKVKEAKQPGEKKDAPKSPPKGYPESKDDYADPTNYKYPLDTEKHVRAALSYAGNPENRTKGGYSPEEWKFMWRRIIARTKKYGIELSDDVKKKAEMVGPPDEGGENELDDKAVEALLEQKLTEFGKAFEAKLKNQAGTGGALDADAVKKMADEYAAFKTKHEELGKRLAAMEELVKGKMDEFDKKFGEFTKAHEQKMKEMAATSNAQAVVAGLDHIFGGKGALPTGHEEGTEITTVGPRDFGDAMTKASKAPRERKE